MILDYHWSPAMINDRELRVTSKQTSLLSVSFLSLVDVFVVVAIVIIVNVVADFLLLLLLVMVLLLLWVLITPHFYNDN